MFARTKYYCNGRFYGLQWRDARGQSLSFLEGKQGDSDIPPPTMRDRLSKTREIGLHGCKEPRTHRHHQERETPQAWDQAGLPAGDIRSATCGAYLGRHRKDQTINHSPVPVEQASRGANLGRHRRHVLPVLAHQGLVQLRLPP